VQSIHSAVYSHHSVGICCLLFQIQEEEDEEEEEEEENGWVDTVPGDNYVAIYGDLLDGYTSPFRCWQ
jgi:hypothetical protein